MFRKNNNHYQIHFRPHTSKGIRERTGSWDPEKSCGLAFRSRRLVRKMGWRYGGRVTSSMLLRKKGLCLCLEKKNKFPWKVFFFNMISAQWWIKQDPRMVHSFHVTKMSCHPCFPATLTSQGTEMTVTIKHFLHHYQAPAPTMPEMYLLQVRGSKQRPACGKGYGGESLAAEP